MTRGLPPKLFLDGTYILHGSFGVLDDELQFKLSYRYMVDVAACFQDHRSVLEAILFFVCFAGECAKFVFDRDGRFLLCQEMLTCQVADDRARDNGPHLTGRLVGRAFLSPTCLFTFHACVIS